MEEEIVTVEEDVSYLPVTAIDLLLDNKNFQITMKLKDNTDKVLSEKTIDLPIEEMITDGKYDNDTKSIVLTKKSGDTFSIDISNIIDGLATQASVADKTSEMKKDIDDTNKIQNENIQNNTKDIQIIFKYLGDNQFLNKEKTYAAAINANTNKIDKFTETLSNYSLVTETGSKIDLSIDNSTFVMTLKLKDKNDKVLSTQTIDFPLETMVVNGSYDEMNKQVILTLQNNKNISIPVGALIDGLVGQKDYDKQVETFNNQIKAINTSLNNLDKNKQDELTAGDNIDITNNVIKTTGVYTEAQVDGLLDNKQKKIDRLDSITDSLPSENSKGSNITIENAPKAPLKDIKIYGDCYQDTSNKIYKCVGDETGVYDFTYDSKIYEFTMPTITSDSILVFNTNDLTLKLGDNKIETSVVDTATGTSIELLDTPNPDYPVEIKTVTGENKITISNGTESKEYPLSLGDLELCSIGDYKDYIHYDGKWWKHKEIKKINNINNYLGEIISNNIYRIKSNDLNITRVMLSNYFNRPNRYVDKPAINQIYNRVGNYYNVEMNAGFTTIEEYKDFFDKNNVVSYGVITPTEEEITDSTLISQLNNIRNAMTYDGETNIIVTSENDNLPAILGVDTFKKIEANAQINKIEHIYLNGIEQEIDSDRSIHLDTHEIHKLRRSKNTSSTRWEKYGEFNKNLVASATKNGSEVRNDYDNLHPWCDIYSYDYDTTSKIETAKIGDSSFAFDGSMGEVLTRYPDSYFRAFEDDNYEYIWFSAYPFKDSIKVDSFSFARYETSKDSNDKVHSVSGALPLAWTDLPHCRKLATAVGDDFCLEDWRRFVVNMFYLVEYGDYNAQNTLGLGITRLATSNNATALIGEENTNRIIIPTSQKTAFLVGQNCNIGNTKSWDADLATNRTITAINDYSENDITGVEVQFDGEPVTTSVGDVLWCATQRTGELDSLGMRSGSLNATDGKHAVIYRGVENPFGNISEWTDGLNIKDHQLYVCYNPKNYVSDKFEEPYKPVGYICADESGQAKALGFDKDNPLVRIPTSIRGSTGTYISDYYAQNAGNRVVRVGGSFSDWENAGLFYWDGSNSSGGASLSLGSRLLRY